MHIINKILLIVILLFLKSGTDLLKSQNDGYEYMRQGFMTPPENARPKAYWWCLNGNIDTVRAKAEFLAMKNAGISGFDIFEIGVPKEDTMIPGGPAFMSDESLQILKAVIMEAGRLNMSVGLNLASSWNAGGSWTKPEHAGKSLYFSKAAVKGKKGEMETKLPFPDVTFPRSSLIGGTGKPMVPFRDNGSPEYYEEVAVLAIPAGIARNSLDTSSVIDVTSFFDPVSDILKWKVPSGDWDIYRYVCSNSGQELVLPSPSSAGLTIDHFDSAAVETHLMYIINRLTPLLGDFRKTALKSLYLASYEARGFVWTSSLPDEFRKVNGYNITKFLPSLFDPEQFNKKTTEKVQSDFKKTLSELMIKNLYKKSKEIANRYGLKINCEAGGPGYPLYNGPAEPLKALGALDIPRGEFWVNHSRYYKVKNGADSIDILRVVKEVAAASHIYGRGMVEEESFTSFQHWQEGPGYIKPFGDRAFCEGLNRVVLHGFSHNPQGTGFPGYVYHAGTHFNDKRVWWPKVRPFFDYLSRNSFVFQEADFVSDVLWYYGDKVPNSAAPKNTKFIVGPGYDYEVINTEILINDLTVKEGRLFLPGGADFSLLALDKEEVTNPQVMTKLQKLADAGAVITGTTQEDMIKALDAKPDFSYRDSETFLLDYIHYRKDDLDFYFIRNTDDNWISRKCSFRQSSKTPELWDPVTGRIVPVNIYDTRNEYINLPVTLPPYGSCFIVFRKTGPLMHYTDIKGDSQDPPLLEYPADGILLLKEGKNNLIKYGRTKTVDNGIELQTIEGPWDLTFPQGWGAPEKLVLPALISWTLSGNDGVKYFSGIASYRKSFRYKNRSASSTGKKIYLDLGDISQVGEVWLNDKPLGITWTKPYRYDVTGIIINGENVLRVEIANSWCNRITGDAITGEKFTNTNITHTSYPGTTRLNVPWAEVPLIESGLLGPVTVETVDIVH